MQAGESEDYNFIKFNCKTFARGLYRKILSLEENSDETQDQGK